MSALGRNWHPDHFRCGGCQCSLQNIGFVEEEGSMFCENCYNQRFAPKCASCNQPIIGVSEGLLLRELTVREGGAG